MLDRTHISGYNNRKIYTQQETNIKKNIKENKLMITNQNDNSRNGERSNVDNECLRAK